MHVYSKVSFLVVLVLFFPQTKYLKLGTSFKKIKRWDARGWYQHPGKSFCVLQLGRETEREQATWKRSQVCQVAWIYNNLLLQELIHFKRPGLIPSEVVTP
jgi:hypothetical protein